MACLVLLRRTFPEARVGEKLIDEEEELFNASRRCNLCRVSTRLLRCPLRFASVNFVMVSRYVVASCKQIALWFKPVVAADAR